MLVRAEATTFPETDRGGSQRLRKFFSHSCVNCFAIIAIELRPEPGFDNPSRFVAARLAIELSPVVSRISNDPVKQFCGSRS